MRCERKKALLAIGKNPNALTDLNVAKSLAGDSQISSTLNDFEHC
jgi:hypothetical protein